MVFRNEAEALLGVTAEEFGNHKLNVIQRSHLSLHGTASSPFFQQSESLVEEIVRKAMNQERIFKLRAKAEQYNVTLPSSRRAQFAHDAALRFLGRA